MADEEKSISVLSLIIVVLQTFTPPSQQEAVRRAHAHANVEAVSGVPRGYSEQYSGFQTVVFLYSRMESPYKME